MSSKQAWDKTTYFQAYQKSFKEGEYNLSEPVYTPGGQVIRRYMSGGIDGLSAKSTGAFRGNSPISPENKALFIGVDNQLNIQDPAAVMSGSPIDKQVADGLLFNYKNKMDKFSTALHNLQHRVPQTVVKRRIFPSISDEMQVKVWRYALMDYNSEGKSLFNILSDIGDSGYNLKYCVDEYLKKHQETIKVLKKSWTDSAIIFKDAGVSKEDIEAYAQDVTSTIEPYQRYLVELLKRVEKSRRQQSDSPLEIAKGVQKYLDGPSLFLPNFQRDKGKEIIYANLFGEKGFSQTIADLKKFLKHYDEIGLNANLAAINLAQEYNLSSLIIGKFVTYLVKKTRGLTISQESIDELKESLREIITIKKKSDENIDVESTIEEIIKKGDDRMLEVSSASREKERVPSVSVNDGGADSPLTVDGVKEKYLEQIKMDKKLSELLLKNIKPNWLERIYLFFKGSIYNYKNLETDIKELIVTLEGIEKKIEASSFQSYPALLDYFNSSYTAVDLHLQKIKKEKTEISEYYEEKWKWLGFFYNTSDELELYFLRLNTFSYERIRGNVFAPLILSKAARVKTEEEIGGIPLTPFAKGGRGGFSDEEITQIQVDGDKYRKEAKDVPGAGSEAGERDASIRPLIEMNPENIKRAVTFFKEHRPAGLNFHPPPADRDVFSDEYFKKIGEIFIRYAQGDVNIQEAAEKIVQETNKITQKRTGEIIISAQIKPLLAVFPEVLTVPNLDLDARIFLPKTINYLMKKDDALTKEELILRLSYWSDIPPSPVDADQIKLAKELIERVENRLVSEVASSSLTSTVGGIDLTQMKMLIQPQGSFASSSLDFSLPMLSRAEIESFDLDQELTALQRMASSGIAPNPERFKEDLAICFAQGRTGREIDRLKSCLEDVFEQHQLEAKETPDGYKEVLVVADTRSYVRKEGRFAAGKQNTYSLN